jgi:hypothetical protein
MTRARVRLQRVAAAAALAIQQEIECRSCIPAVSSHGFLHLRARKAADEVQESGLSSRCLGRRKRR